MNLSLFRKRNFTLVILGKFVSLLGTIFQEFALSLYVLNQTGSGTKFASVLAIALIPKLILGPFAGVLADWFDRKKMVVILDTLSGVIVAGFGVLFMVNGYLSLLQIYILVLALSIISVIFSPTMGTMIPMIVKKEELGDANAINSLVTSITSVIAPLIAGIVFGLAGLLPVLVINAISFMLSAFSESFIQVIMEKTEKVNMTVKQFFLDFNEGIKSLKSDRDLVILLGVGTLVNFAIGPMFAVGVPFILKQRLFVSDFQFGLFEALVCIGPLLASLVAGKVMKKYPFYHWNTIAFVISSVLIFLIGFICHPLMLQLEHASIIGFIALTVLSFGIVSVIVISNIALGTTMQSRVDIKVMGRVIAVYGTIVTASMPLGQIIIGVLLDTSMETYIIIGGVGIILLLGGLLNYILYLPKKNLALED